MSTSTIEQLTCTEEFSRGCTKHLSEIVFCNEILEPASITSLPKSAYYVSSFISEEEEGFLVNKISSQQISNWRTLSHRRLQVYPSTLSARSELQKGPLPSWIENPLISRLTNLRVSTDNHDEGLFTDSPHQRPNHVLVNEYPPGVGISPHEDGAAYFPLVATVSLGGHTVLDIYEKDKEGQRKAKPTWRILQERRSLLITQGDLYKNTLHGIADIPFDENLTASEIVNWELLRDETRFACLNGQGRLERDLRISATIRDVIKVKDYSRLLPGLGGRKM